MADIKKRKPKPSVSKEKNECGFMDDEQVVMDKLIECYKSFIDLDHEHPDEMRDFVDGVHRIQDVLGMRVLRRVYPNGWPTYKV